MAGLNALGVSANDMISLYLSLELQSLALYVVAAINRDSVRSTEAGLKYFVLGALSSGMLLYGISLLFAAAGGVTTNLAELNGRLALVSANGSLLVSAGVLMVLVGGLVLLVLTRPAERRRPRRDAIELGLLLGLAVLTRATRWCSRSNIRRCSTAIMPVLKAPNTQAYIAYTPLPRSSTT